MTPAIATIEEIRSRNPSWRLIFIGRKNALEGNTTVSEEYRLITGMGIRFLPLVAGRMKREKSLASVWALLKVPVGYIQASIYVWKERPSIVVSFGGYVGLPVTFVAWCLGIPVIIHEQTTRPGLANRLIGRLARHVCVTFEDTATQFHSKHVTVTGLPMRKSVMHPPERCPISLSHGNKPILFVVGGNTGSLSINKAIYPILPELLRDFTVMHQVGRVSETRVKEVVKNLASDIQPHYIPMAYVHEDLYSWIIHHAKLVIGRSGANTVMELGVAAAVVICIPLPWSARDEQNANAAYLERGGATTLLQSDLTPDSLHTSIKKVLASWEERKEKARQFSTLIPKDGAPRFVDVIEGELSTQLPRV